MTIDTQTGLSAAPAPSLDNETLAAADRERRALARQLHELTAACNHLLYVGEFCRTDDTDSALRRLRAVLSAHQVDPLEMAISEAIGEFVMPGAPWSKIREAIARRGGTVIFDNAPAAQADA